MLCATYCRYTFENRLLLTVYNMWLGCGAYITVVGNLNVCRYFQCPPQHGLFAPLPRVEKAAGEAPAPVSHPPTSQTPQHPTAVTSVSAQRSPHGSFGVSPASSLNRGVPPPLRHTLSSSTIGSVTSESHALTGGRQQVVMCAHHTQTQWLIMCVHHTLT